MSHNLFEYWLHPQRFRTKLCKNAGHCDRPFCFFAHTEAQVRQASEPPKPLPSFAAALATSAGMGSPGRTTPSGGNVASGNLLGGALRHPAPAPGPPSLPPGLLGDAGAQCPVVQQGVPLMSTVEQHILLQQQQLALQQATALQADAAVRLAQLQLEYAAGVGGVAAAPGSMSHQPLGPLQLLRPSSISSAGSSGERLPSFDSQGGVRHGSLTMAGASQLPNACSPLLASPLDLPIMQPTSLSVVADSSSGALPQFSVSSPTTFTAWPSMAVTAGMLSPPPTLPLPQLLPEGVAATDLLLQETTAALQALQALTMTSPGAPVSSYLPQQLGELAIQPLTPLNNTSNGHVPPTCGVSSGLCDLPQQQLFALE
jgi:hypothetical protein